MDSSNLESSPVRRQRPAAWGACIIVTILLVVLILPAIQAAREAARKHASTNNLKQIGLGLQNYHDVYKRLPPGGLFRENGTGLHGWPTLVAPFLEAESLLSEPIDLTLPWDDPRQIDKLFQSRFKCYADPSVSQKITSDGIKVTHYSANEWLMHRNSKVTLFDLESPSQTLLLADAFGEFPPIYEPFNWRDPTVRLQSSMRQFGGSARRATLVVFADASVSQLAPTIDERLFKSFAGPAKLRPSTELVARPTELYRLKSTEYWRYLACRSVTTHEKKFTIVALKQSPGGNCLEVTFKVPASERSLWVPQFQRFVKDKPIEHVRIFGKLNVTDLEPLLEIKTLKRLSIGEAHIFGDKAEVLKARRDILVD